MWHGQGSYKYAANQPSHSSCSPHKSGQGHLRPILLVVSSFKQKGVVAKMFVVVRLQTQTASKHKAA
jgi:hypothetical protein